MDIPINVTLNPLEWPSLVFAALMAIAVILRIVLPWQTNLGLRVTREVLVILPAVLLYFLVRGLVNGNEATAIRHGEQIITLEKRLGIWIEPDLQRTLLSAGLAHRPRELGVYLGTLAGHHHDRLLVGSPPFRSVSEVPQCTADLWSDRHGDFRDLSGSSTTSNAGLRTRRYGNEPIKLLSGSPTTRTRESLRRHAQPALRLEPAHGYRPGTGIAAALRAHHWVYDPCRDATGDHTFGKSLYC